MSNVIITTAAFLILLISAAAQTPVLDSDGNPLLSGTKYYILPAIDSRPEAVDNLRGGVTPIAINASAPCPLDVLQAGKKTHDGTPVTFTPVDPKQVVIQESIDLNIKFSSVPAKCPNSSTVWQLATEEDPIGNLYVRTGGVAGNPGAATVNNWFKIEKVQKKNYNIVFCPRVCDTCKVSCDEIGVYVDGKGRWRLAQMILIGNPFLVKFKKA